MDSLDFFRRNLKPLMGALTIMAMITFVFDDSMRANSPTLIPFILAFLFGGGAFVWGTRRGKQNEYLAMGAFFGGVLGLTIIMLGEMEQGTQAEVAGLSRQDIINLRNRRETANRIVGLIYTKSHPMPEQFKSAGQFGQQFYQMQLQRALEQIRFTFGNDDFEKDVIFGDLLRREAGRLGIRVNDDAVSDFIKLVSDQKLSTQDFREIRQELNTSDHAIYEMLRDEISARMAAEMTFPRAVATPQQRWEAFRKVNVKNAIEATTIPVDAFVKGVTEPTDSDLRSYFRDHAEKFPSAKGEPGFRQPARAKLAYLEADYETIDEKVTRPTDEEVAKHYEDNKEFFIDRTPTKTESKDEAPEGDESKKPDAEKSDKPDEKKDGDKPADSEKPKADKPKDEPAEKPKAEPKKDEEPKTEKKSDTDGSACDDKDEDAKKADESKTETPAKADADKPENKKDDAKTDDKKADDAPKADSKEDKPAADGDKKDAAETPEDKAEKKPEVKYKPFDDVKDDIADQLLRARTLAEMKSRIEAAVKKMRRLGSYTFADKESKSYKSPADVAAELKEIAIASNLKYVETSWVSAEELSKSDELKIATASDPMSEALGQQGALSVIQRVFGGGSDALFAAEVAEDSGTKNRFAYWVVERKEVHVPKFEDEGIRDQVAKVWKLNKAIPDAERRAKDLVKLAEGKKLSEVLAGETVTGAKDGQALTVIAPEGKISHFTVSGLTAPGVNPFQGGEERAELTPIAGLDKLGDDFYSGIDKLKVGESAALPNFDRSAFIVVHVTEREDIAAEEDAPQRADFLKSWTSPTNRPANQIASFDFDPLRREWMQSIERKYNVKWPVK